MKALRHSRNILVINLKYIGDTIWMYPLIKNLRYNIPDAKISALVNEGTEAFLKLLPELHEVIGLRRKEMKSKAGYLKFAGFLRDIRKRSFDSVIILSNSDRPTLIALATGASVRIGLESDSWWRAHLLTHKFQWDHERNPHMIEQHLQLLTDSGLHLYDTRLTITVPDAVVNTVKERFPVVQKQERKAVLIHPGSRTRFRQWGSGNFAAVINALADRYRIFLVGGPGEQGIIKEIIEELHRSPDLVTTDLNLLEFAALCTFSDLFIGNDTAPIHIAAGVGVFVIGMYGPTFSRNCGPWTEKRALFDVSTLPCRPCRQEECCGPSFRACIEEITPEMVIKKAREVLSAS